MKPIKTHFHIILLLHQFYNNNALLTMFSYQFSPDNQSTFCTYPITTKPNTNASLNSHNIPQAQVIVFSFVTHTTLNNATIMTQH